MERGERIGFDFKGEEGGDVTCDEGNSGDDDEEVNDKKGKEDFKGEI